MGEQYGDSVPRKITLVEAKVLTGFCVAHHLLLNISMESMNMFSALALGSLDDHVDEESDNNRITQAYQNCIIFSSLQQDYMKFAQRCVVAITKKLSVEQRRNVHDVFYADNPDGFTIGTCRKTNELCDRYLDAFTKKEKLNEETHITKMLLGVDDGEAESQSVSSNLLGNVESIYAFVHAIDEVEFCRLAFGVTVEGSESETVEDEATRNLIEDIFKKGD